MEESDDDMSIDSKTDILTDEILKGKSYSCFAVRHAKRKDNFSLETKVDYAFDITKVGQIFDYLVKGKKVLQMAQLIQLLDG